MTVKVMHRLLALIMTVFMFASINTAYAVDDAYPSTYTYNYDYWSDIRESPDAYRVESVLFSGDLGLVEGGNNADAEMNKAMKKPQSLYVRNNDLYVCDTGNNRILQITKGENGYQLTRIITEIKGCEVTKLNSPNDVFVDEQDNLYIADTNNNRVVMVDKDLNYIKEFVKPSNAVFDIAKNGGAAYTAEEAEGGAEISLVLPIGGYTVTEKASSVKMDGVTTTIVGNNAVAYVRENQAVTASVINLYSTEDKKLDANQYKAPAAVYAELTEEEQKLVDEAVSTTGVPHGVMKLKAEHVFSTDIEGGKKPLGVKFDVNTSTIEMSSSFVSALRGDGLALAFDVKDEEVKPKSYFFSDFRSGVLSVMFPIGSYTISEQLATAKVPGFETEILGSGASVYVREEQAALVSFMNLYSKVGEEADNSGYTVAEPTYVELTEAEKQSLAEKTSQTGVPYGLLKIKADAVGAEIPSNTVFDQALPFQPSKVVADVSGRIFALATNVNKGLIKFETDMSFNGFVGANKVSYNLAEYMWKTYFMTKEQRAQQANFVPTEYQNIYIDNESFIYATNIVFSEYDLLYDVAQPIRRLNGIGNDILIKNDRYPPIGDLYWIEQNVALGPSKLVDITVLDNDIYVAVDKTRGRIFGYDSQGVMLWAFGTTGSSEGAFKYATSIEHMGKDLFVLDQNEGSITVFTPTEYGELIYKATTQYLSGEYDASADTWREVLRLNANYNLAFIGIGRSLMRQEKYKDAMDCFEMANDRDNYGRAFRFYRAEMVEQNIIWMVLVLAAVLLIPVVLKMIKKMRMEVEAYERNQVHK